MDPRKATKLEQYLYDISGYASALEILSNGIASDEFDSESKEEAVSILARSIKETVEKIRDLELHEPKGAK